jgi:excisionase family DNA binding protein
MNDLQDCKSNKSPRFFTIANVAESLDVSSRTIRRAIKSGRLRAHHFGRAVRIADYDWIEFLEAHRDYRC